VRSIVGPAVALDLLAAVDGHVADSDPDAICVGMNIVVDDSHEVEENVDQAASEGADVGPASIDVGPDDTSVELDVT
jgi:hypothetical protein